MSYKVSLFEASQKQYLEKDFIEIDENFLKENNIDFEEWVNTFEKFGLNSDKVFLVKNSLYSRIYYIADYVATEIIPDINILNTNEFIGLHIVLKREELYKKMFENEEYELCFHPEFNPLALYYFIKHYKDINKEKLYDVFITCYQSISFGFNDIPEELYYEVFKYAPDINTVIEHFKEDYPNKQFKADDIITIYRSQSSKSTPIEKAYSWTTNYNFAKKLQNHNKGVIYKGLAELKDIIDYLCYGENEVLIKYKDVSDLEEIKYGLNKDI